MNYIHSDDHEILRFFPRSGIGQGNEQLIGWDGVRYDWIASNFLNGQGFGYKPGQPDSWRPPGYPFFLIAVYFLFGKDYYTVRVFQVIFSTFAILFSYLIARKVAGRSAGLASAAICALYHDAVVFPLIYYSETLFMFLISGLIYMLMNFSAFDHRGGRLKWGYPVVIGLIAGYAALVRPIYLLSYPFIALGLLWYCRDVNLTARKIAVMTVALLIVLAPWCIRNSYIEGKPTFISTNGGLNLAMGFCENADGFFLKESQRFTPEEKQLIADKGYGAVASRFVLSNPVRTCVLYLKKIRIQLFEPSARRNIVRFTGSPIPMPAYYPLTMILFLGGLTASLFGGRKRFAVLYGYLAGYILMSAFFFYMGDRHRIPLVPVYAVFGGYIVSVIYRQIKLRIQLG